MDRDEEPKLSKCNKCAYKLTAVGKKTLLQVFRTNILYFHHLKNIEMAHFSLTHNFQSHLLQLKA